MKKIGIGVIGVGGRGNLANGAHRPDEGVRIVAGADPYEPARKAFVERIGNDVFVCKDYKTLLARNDVDAVFICSPDYCHERQAIAALKAGKHVYLEKPIAITINGADRILKAAYESGSKLFLGHNMRYFSSVLKMKEIIDAGTIGEIKVVWCRHFIAYGGDAYFKDWHSERKYSTGLLLQKGAHDMDVIHWLAGAYTASVVAMGKLDVYDKCKRRKPSERGDARFTKTWPPMASSGMSPTIDVEDHNMVLMQLANGVQASYLQCHYTPDSTRNYTFIGTKGRLENLGDSGDCRVAVWTERTHQHAEPNIIHRLDPVSGGHGGGDPRTIEAFIRFIRDGVAPNTNPVAARYSVAAGVKATESLRRGSRLMQVPTLDPELEAYFTRGQKRKKPTRQRKR